jgi:transcriptional regulator with XRE-family HTH domain
MPGDINENIKSIRELKNYSQEYMAFRLGITQAGYSKMERNGSRISFEKLEEIAVIFEMDLGSIINFGSALNFKSTLQNMENRSAARGGCSIENLYRDKIVLLEKLLDITDRELTNYKDRFGCL